MCSVSVRLVIIVLTFCDAALSGKKSKKMARIITNQWLLRKNFCCALLSVISMFSGACDSSKKLSTKNKSVWAKNAIVIDGKNNDWQLPYPFTENKEAKIQYAIANNRQTLYLTIKTSDEITKKKIIKNGLTVCIDTNGNKDQSTFITIQLLSPHPIKAPPRFPMLENTAGGNVNMPLGEPPSFPPGDMSGGRPGMNRPPEDRGYAPQNDMADTGQLHIASITVGGPQKYSGTYLSPDNSSGVVVAVAYNDYNEMVWEIAVEFQTFYKKQIEQNDANRKVSIGFLINGVDNEYLSEINALKIKPSDALPPGGNDKGANASPGGMSGGGMGGGIPGGGMPGGSMSGGGMPDGGDKMQHNDGQNTISEERQRALKDVVIWKQIKLHFQ